MSSSPRDLPAFLGRWPRRLAALACLAVAGASALSARADPPPPRSGPTPRPVVEDRLGVPVHVRGSPGYLHAGDRVDLIAAPAAAPPGWGGVATAAGGGTVGGSVGAGATVVAGDLPVLRVEASADGTGSDLVLGVDRDTALRIAGLGARDLIAATVSSP